MAEKIVTCKKCGAQMFDSISVCKQCGQKRVSSMQRMIIYGVVGVVLLILILIIRSTINSNIEENSKQKEQETVAAGAEVETTDDVGVVYEKNGINFCIKSAEYYGSIGAGSGKKYIQVYVSVSNTTEDAYAFNLSDYECSVGVVKFDKNTPSTAVQKEIPLLKTSLVEAGSTVEGYIFYAVPLDATSVKIRNSAQNITWKLNIN